MTIYAIGDRVRVNQDPHITQHVRTPWYIQGKCGTIVKIHGSFPNPEDLAYGIKTSYPIILYMVEFDLMDIWLSATTRERQQFVCVDIFEHWLTGI